MPSTFTTDPIGPRSIAEMLDVVYARADGHRRRRTVRRIGVAAVAVLVGTAAMATLRGGDPDAHVRLVDQPNGQQQQKDALAPPQVEATAQPTEGTSVSGSAGRKAAAKKAEESQEVDATVRHPEGVPPLPADNRPRLETWADDTDGLNDSTPDDWYFDISTTAMQFDTKAEMVVFTTSYRVPDSSPETTRATRVLESHFAYEGQTFTVSVRESGNQLGTVNIDDLFDCDNCIPRFDAPTGTLVVNVPLARLNEAVTRRSSPLGAGADIMSVTALTIRANGSLIAQQADSTDAS